MIFRISPHTRNYNCIVSKKASVKYSPILGVKYNPILGKRKYQKLMKKCYEAEKKFEYSARLIRIFEFHF